MICKCCEVNVTAYHHFLHVFVWGQYEWFSGYRNVHGLIPWSHICLSVYKIACLSLYVITVENIMQWYTNIWTSNHPLYEGSDRFRSSIQQLGMNIWMYRKRIFVFNHCGMHILCFSKTPSWIRKKFQAFLMPTACWMRGICSSEFTETLQHCSIRQQILNICWGYFLEESCKMQNSSAPS